ncbi:MAG: sensor histidine kinase [Opitutaceae bacterium]
MKRIIRLTGLALGLLLLFLGAVTITTSWLKRQNEHLLGERLETKSAEFNQILALAKPGPPPWREEFVRDLGRAIGGEVTVQQTAPPAGWNAHRGAGWHFVHAIRNPAGEPVAYALVQLPPSATARVMLAFQRAAALLLLLALVLLLAMLLLVLLDRTWTGPTEDGAAPLRSTNPADYGMITHLAASSVRQSAELEREREERQRAEADAHLKQILLARALQEKVDMGRDLHDGLIQSLYATGLTIQAGRKALDHDQAEARTQIDTALQTLNAAIREVRAYISGLGPEQLRQRSFADSVRAVVEHHCAVRGLTVDIRIDEEAASRLTPAQTTDLLQIVREAVSNSVRHGHAQQLSARLHRNGDELCLLLQDNGRGFDLPTATRGHGLDNLQARAERLGAKLQYHTAPGQGTRLVLTFTVPASTQRS